MNGPNQEPSFCTMAQDCVISITGAGLFGTNGILLIVGNAAVCGANYNIPGVFGGFSQNPVNPEDAASKVFNFKVMTQVEEGDVSLEVSSEGAFQERGFSVIYLREERPFLPRAETGNSSRWQYNSSRWQYSSSRWQYNSSRWR